MEKDTNHYDAELFDTDPFERGKELAESNEREISAAIDQIIEDYGADALPHFFKGIKSGGTGKIDYQRIFNDYGMQVKINENPYGDHYINGELMEWQDIAVDKKLEEKNRRMR